MNVNCWSKNNCELREKILTCNNPDIICVVETHLKGDVTINIPNYTFFGLNRKLNIDKNYRGSGGIGIFLRNSLQNNYQIERCLEIEDNILGN